MTERSARTAMSRARQIGNLGFGLAALVIAAFTAAGQFSLPRWQQVAYGVIIGCTLIGLGLENVLGTGNGKRARRPEPGSARPLR
jgi:hypothetical protein